MEAQRPPSVRHLRRAPFSKSPLPRRWYKWRSSDALRFYEAFWLLDYSGNSILRIRVSMPFSWCGYTKVVSRERLSVKVAHSFVDVKMRPWRLLVIEANCSKPSLLSRYYAGSSFGGRWLCHTTHHEGLERKSTTSSPPSCNVRPASTARGAPRTPAQSVRPE